ncbi:hypothetical protein LV89_01802 [Arcicella aurantiaca]|uniref:Uncharacterized protein n=1 Tax=Arcicella aurantiaca TaxID=591202 RepID=A0A316E910_9BACT|nr:three component ABC system middle component [Arcicella aurantiaca]PWK26990.1 hypothetical protein LV89_01802 [Arcicella aurantiaca]
MLPNWDERSNTIAHLLNPAFCGEVIRRCMFAYQKEQKTAMPFQLAFLILPIVLHKENRERLPKTSGKNFISWIEENQIIKKDLPNIIKNINSFTKESIMFLMMYKIIIINESGNFEAIAKGKILSYENEVVECYKKAELLGKLLAKAGNSQFIFVNLGIKP